MKKAFAVLASLIVLFSLIGVAPAVAAGGGVTRQIPRSGTTPPQTGAFAHSGAGDVTQAELVGSLDTAAGPGPYGGAIVNGRLAQGASGGGGSVSSGQKAKSDPQFVTGFQGLNHYQQRYTRGGNQFSVEPPDQGLCAGNGFVVEVVNDVLNVYNASGQSQLTDNTATNIIAGHPRKMNHAIDLNSFWGYAPAINRSTPVRAQFVTDPTSLSDSPTHHFF